MCPEHERCKLKHQPQSCPLFFSCLLARECFFVPCKMEALALTVPVQPRNFCDVGSEDFGSFSTGVIAGMKGLLVLHTSQKKLPPVRQSKCTSTQSALSVPLQQTITQTTRRVGVPPRVPQRRLPPCSPAEVVPT